MSARVPGEGPTNARLFFLGEHPGIDEVRRGRNFIGRTSVEFNRYLNGILLPDRSEVFIANLVRELPQGKHITQAEIDRDLPDLYADLYAVRPEIIVTMGRHSTRHFLGDVDMEMVHGIPHVPDSINLCALETLPTIFPTYHPAAAIHAPELAALFAYDMRRLSLLLKGRLPAKKEDTAPEHYYDADICHVLQFIEEWHIFGKPPIGFDSEGWTHAPWSVQVSIEPGHALVIRDRLALAQFREFVARENPEFVFHPALHELPMCRVLNIPVRRYTDTSIKAYLLGIEPQGAKPLFYRHAGMLQDSYSEITKEAGEARAREWLLELLNSFPRFDADRLPKEKRPRRKKGEPKPLPEDRTVPELEKKLRLIEAMLMKEDPEGTLRERWGNCEARRYLEDEMELIGSMPEPTLDEIPLPVAIRYAGRDADGTARINEPLDQQIDAMDLRPVLEADLAALPMIDRMQEVGMLVDRPYLQGEVSSFLQWEWDSMQAELDAFAGRSMNVNSAPQVSQWLFEELGLPGGKKTKGGDFSTNDKILESIRKHPQTLADGKKALEFIQEIREIRKMKSSFCDKLPDFIKEDGRIHPNLRITRVATGRLAASDPNLLAFPKHSHRGKMIRAGFIAPEGRLLGEWDLSQIEMRVFAIDSGDERMIEQFNSGYDFHLMGAAQRYNKKPEDVTKFERFTQKAINFGVLMGITEHGLLDQFHKGGHSSATLDDMKRFLDAWFKQYPNAGPYIESKHAEARRYGFVRDMWGRLRYCPGINSYDNYIRSAAEREAQATPTQSGAQGIVKRWMAQVWERLLLTRGSYQVEPLLQVHDALILEFPEGRYEAVDSLMQNALDQLQMFPVPITMEGQAGKRWSDL